MYADIAAVLETHPDPASRLQLICGLARELKTKVIVLHVQILEEPPMALVLGSHSALAEAEQATVQASLREVENKSAFEGIAADAGLAWEWHELGDPVTSRIARHARCADLVVLFGQDRSTGRHVTAVDIPSIIMECGRPVLVIPASQPSLRLPFRRIVIGWNGSREASRAIHDALPFLRVAERVVVAVAAEESLFREEDEPELDIGRHLARHGVQAEVERLATPGHDPGALLLSLAANISADLVVAGCYGHMRLTEFLFGGVTRTLLNDPGVPLLLSY